MSRVERKTIIPHILYLERDLVDVSQIYFRPAGECDIPVLEDTEPTKMDGVLQEDDLSLMGYGKVSNHIARKDDGVAP